MSTEDINHAIPVSFQQPSDPSSPSPLCDSDFPSDIHVSGWPSHGPATNSKQPIRSPSLRPKRGEIKAQSRPSRVQTEASASVAVSRPRKRPRRHGTHTASSRHTRSRQHGTMACKGIKYPGHRLAHSRRPDVDVLPADPRTLRLSDMATVSIALLPRSTSGHSFFSSSFLSRARSLVPLHFRSGGRRWFSRHQSPIIAAPVTSPRPSRDFASR